MRVDLIPAFEKAMQGRLPGHFGIRLLARIVSVLVRQRVTDTTSGFQALNRRALAL